MGFLEWKLWISINISLKFVPRGAIYNIPTLGQVMALRRPGDKPLSEPMMVRLPTHICVARPQWVNPCTILLMNNIRKCFVFQALWLDVLAVFGADKYSIEWDKVFYCMNMYWWQLLIYTNHFQICTSQITFNFPAVLLLWYHYMLIVDIAE